MVYTSYAPALTQLRIEGIRGFSTPQTVEIRPLTFFVGEQSTGKTTALHAYHAGFIADFGTHAKAPFAPETFHSLVTPGANTFNIGFTLFGGTFIEPEKRTMTFSPSADREPPDAIVTKKTTSAFYDAGPIRLRHNLVTLHKLHERGSVHALGTTPPMLRLTTASPQTREADIVFSDDVYVGLAEVESVDAFGRSADLFEEIALTADGLHLRMHGHHVPIAQTSYGIQMLLPLLLRITSIPGIHLLQNPEIGLHPKAQAALTTKIIRLATLEEPPSEDIGELPEEPPPRETRRAFIVETHSDAMIDRARIDIRNGHISYKDVSLVYFEKYEHGTRVHNISFDKQANLLNIPEHYRAFFLKEADRLMGFEA